MRGLWQAGHSTGWFHPSVSPEALLVCWASGIRGCWTGHSRGMWRASSEHLAHLSTSASVLVILRHLP